MQHDPMSSGHDDPRAGVGAWTDPPLADATRLRPHLNDLARSGSDTPRPFARRRAAAIASFATDHDDDLARAGLAADRRASLLVRAARLEDAVAWEAWDEVRAIVAGMTFHLAAVPVPGPGPIRAAPNQDPALAKRPGALAAWSPSHGGQKSRTRRIDLNTGGTDAMSPQPRTLTGRREWSQDPDAREQAALRRVAAQISAEAAELPPNTWLAERLGLEIRVWDKQVLPELALAMAGELGPEPPQSWVRVRPERCPLMLAEEASLRRVATVLRAEAAELGPESSVAAHLEGWASGSPLHASAPAACCASR